LILIGEFKSELFFVIIRNVRPNLSNKLSLKGALSRINYKFVTIIFLCVKNGLTLGIELQNFIC
jgi:hypothetical protein